MARVVVGLCAVGVLFISSGVQAATIAMDSAADSVYATWDPGDNGGTGWGGGWTFRNQSNTVLTTTNGSRGWFVGSSLGNNDPSGSDSNNDGDINTPGNSSGRAWGVYSNSTDQVYAIRPFANTLAVGQTVKWDMDNGNIASGQVVGLRFLSNASDINSRVFEARFVGGDSNYSIVGNPNQSTTIGFSREGLHLEYTLTGTDTFSLSILRKSNGVTQTITGTNVNANSIVALAFKNQFAGSGSAANGYLNSISVMTPNMAPTVVDALYPNESPGTTMHTFTATDPDMDPLTWSGFTFLDYTPAYGGVGSGPLNPAMFDPNTREFSWNNLGSPRGIYRWAVTASDGSLSDEGTITIHKTSVPEPTALVLGTLALIGVGGFSRSRRFQ